MKPHVGRARTGTAFIEALAVVPVLGVILAFAVSIHAMYSAKLEAKARATYLAWLQADSGQCPASSCSTSECDAVASELRRDTLDRIESTGSDGLSLRNFVGKLERFFVGAMTRGVSSASSPLPGIVHENRTTQRSITTLPCNTSARVTELGDSVLEHACATDLRTTDYAHEVCR